MPSSSPSSSFSSSTGSTRSLGLLPLWILLFLSPPLASTGSGFARAGPNDGVLDQVQDFGDLPSATTTTEWMRFTDRGGGCTQQFCLRAGAALATGQTLSFAGCRETFVPYDQLCDGYPEDTARIVVTTGAPGGCRVIECTLVGPIVQDYLVCSGAPGTAPGYVDCSLLEAPGDDDPDFTVCLDRGFLAADLCP